MKIEQTVKGSKGTGKIVKIITRSTGYVTVDYNGILKNEMAFNLTDEAGQPLKAKPAGSGKSKGQKDAEARAAFAAQTNLQKIKQSIMWINGKVQGDRNSLGYQLISERMAGIYLKAKEVGNEYVMAVHDSVIRIMRASEKQAYVLAKFADDNGIVYE